MNDDDLPVGFFCPITHEIMRNPVIDPEGNSYEAAAIREWLKKSSTSPITRSFLRSNDLVPNRALRDTIEAELKKRNLRFDEIRARVIEEQAHPAKDDPQTPRQVDNLQTEVSLSYTKSEHDRSTYNCLVTVQPSIGTESSRTDIVCVIDKSGSMGNYATLGVERTGLSVLDLVKHSVKTVIYALKEHDRIGIVSFSSRAEVTCKLTKMTEAGKKEVCEQLDRLDANGSTNIWDGLQSGLVMLQGGNVEQGRFSHLMLFTDGEPTDRPPRGEVEMLKRLMSVKREHPIPYSINTFGFGYTLDSKLLLDLATVGRGSYNFIPDSSFVGTIFINAMTNLLCCCALNSTIEIIPGDGFEISECLFPGTFVNAKVGHEIRRSFEGTIGSIEYGQNRHIPFKLKSKNPENVWKPVVTVKVAYRDRNSESEIVLEKDDFDNHFVDEIPIHRFRLYMIDTITRAMDVWTAKGPVEARKLIQDLVERVQKEPWSTQNPLAAAMLKDLTGQVTQAFSKAEFYDKWGPHYIRSLANAHLAQQCNNFKDPGVQGYASELFTKIRDETEEIFLKVPAPIPRPDEYGEHGAGSNYAMAPVNMSQYYDAGGGCFGGECTCLMADSSLRKVSAIKAGDSIATEFKLNLAHNPIITKSSVVRCVVRYQLPEGLKLIKFSDGLLITAYHPVKISESWTFPNDLLALDFVHELFLAPVTVYTFVLNSEHVAIINGITVACLGHGFTEAVVKHPFLGTSKVITSLSKFPGWVNGLVDITLNGTKRDPKTGLICDFVSDSE